MAVGGARIRPAATFCCIEIVSTHAQVAGAGILAREAIDHTNFIPAVIRGGVQVVSRHASRTDRMITKTLSTGRLSAVVPVTSPVDQRVAQIAIQTLTKHAIHLAVGRVSTAVADSPIHIEIRLAL